MKLGILIRTGQFQHSFVRLYVFFLAVSEEGEGEDGTYFVDQAGHYYFQAKGAAQPVMTVMSALPSQANAEEGEEFIISQDSEENDNVEVVDDVSLSTGILTAVL